MISKEKEGIKASKKALLATTKAWELQKEDYSRGHQLKKEGKPVVWSCALFPKEIYWAMGIVPFYPEQAASLFSVRRLGGSKDISVPTYSVKYCQIAEAEGFREYICGYARTMLGYVIEGLRTGSWTDAPLGGVPLPNFMITTSFTCDTRMKWIETMAQMLKVPLFVLDVPEIPSDLPAIVPGGRQPILVPQSRLKKGERLFLATPTDYELDYMVSQWEDCISFIEDVTGHKYNPDKLNEALDWSYKTAFLEGEIYQLRKAVPAPMSSADGFACAYPRMYLMGTKRCYDFFVSLRDELKERVEQGIGVIPNEKFRIMWYGLPTWFNMGIFNYFEKIGGVFVWETFYNTGLLPPRRPEDPIKELAIKCFQHQLGQISGPTGIGNALSEMVQEALEYKIDGAVLSYLVTCRYIMFPSTEINKILEEELGIPSVNLESDLVDERIFAESQAFVRLDAFGEQLLKGKEQSKAKG